VLKAKTAFYEERLPFESKMIDGSGPVESGFAAALWPIQRRCSPAHDRMDEGYVATEQATAALPAE